MSEQLAFLTEAIFGFLFFILKNILVIAPLLVLLVKTEINTILNKIAIVLFAICAVYCIIIFAQYEANVSLKYSPHNEFSILYDGIGYLIPLTLLALSGDKNGCGVGILFIVLMFLFKNIRFLRELNLTSPWEMFVNLVGF